MAGLLEIWNDVRVSGRRLTFGGVFAAACLIALPGGAPRAAVHCVRAGAGGNGSGADWENALPRLPDTLVRGDVYYIAAGDYPEASFDTPPQGDTPITIKKATAAEHGPAAGWQAAYGLGKAVWKPVNFATSYYIFDGATGSGRQGHGFELRYDAGKKSLIQFENAASHITIRHAELDYPSLDLPNCDAIYANTTCTQVTIANCHIHDVPGCPLLIRGWTHFTFENNWVARNKSTAADHAEGISTHGGGDFIIRNNVWEDIEGTAVIVNLAHPTRNWTIYGNVFFQSGQHPCGGLGHGVVSDNFEDSAIDGLSFYNNTIVGLRGGASGLQFWAAGSRNIKALNNLWVNCENVAFNNVDYDYNQLNSCTFPYAFQEKPGTNDVVLGSGDPFINAGECNFRLKMPTASGSSLPPPFTVDPDGCARTGQWSRGAFQYTLSKSPLMKIQ